MPLSLGIPIIGPGATDTSVPFVRVPSRAKPRAPTRETAQHVRSETPAARQLPAPMPAQHGLATHVEELRDVARSEQPVIHEIDSRDAGVGHPDRLPGEGKGRRQGRPRHARLRGSMTRSFVSVYRRSLTP